MKKLIRLSFLAIALVVATVNSTNAAFPKDKIVSTEVATTISPVVNTTVEPTITKAQAKKQLKEFKKANNWYAGGSKSKIVAALLAFFLGNLGIHSFYMGNKKKGFIQLGVTVVGIVLLIAGFASAVTSASTGTIAFPTLAIVGMVLLLGVSIWAFVDFIRILTGGLAPEEGFDD